MTGIIVTVVLACVGVVCSAPGRPWIVKISAGFLTLLSFCYVLLGVTGAIADLRLLNAVLCLGLINPYTGMSAIHLFFAKGHDAVRDGYFHFSASDSSEGASLLIAWIGLFGFIAALLAGRSLRIGISSWLILLGILSIAFVGEAGASILMSTPAEIIVPGFIEVSCCGAIAVLCWEHKRVKDA
jgi:hypothetical protein